MVGNVVMFIKEKKKKKEQRKGNNPQSILPWKKLKEVRA